MMKKSAVGFTLALALVAGGQLAAHERDVLASFSGGIGVSPVASVVNPPNADGTFSKVSQNVVRGVAPAGLPWRISDLKAEVAVDGRIRVRGRGLVLAAGSRLGQSLALPVIATLICDTALPIAQHSTTQPVVLDQFGDFRIDDRLDSTPATCIAPLLLIRNSAGQWLAAGIPRADDDN
jgi:hypothetical protein